MRWAWLPLYRPWRWPGHSGYVHTARISDPFGFIAQIRDSDPYFVWLLNFFFFMWPISDFSLNCSHSWTDLHMRTRAIIKHCRVRITWRPVGVQCRPENVWADDNEGEEKERHFFMMAFLWRNECVSMRVGARSFSHLRPSTILHLLNWLTTFLTGSTRWFVSLDDHSEIMSHVGQRGAWPRHGCVVMLSCDWSGTEEADG